MEFVSVKTEVSNADSVLFDGSVYDGTDGKLNIQHDISAITGQASECQCDSEQKIVLNDDLSNCLDKENGCTLLMEEINESMCDSDKSQLLPDVIDGIDNDFMTPDDTGSQKRLRSKKFVKVYTIAVLCKSDEMENDATVMYLSIVYGDRYVTVVVSSEVLIML